MRFAALVVLTLSLHGCRPDAQPQRASDTARAAAGADSAGSRSDPYANYSKLEDEDCGLDSSRAHPEPVALVREFVDRDGRGEFANGGSWLSGAVLCPGHLPGPDAFVAIDTMEVQTGSARVLSDSAWVPVRYGLLGEASPIHFDRAPRALVDTFLVVRTTYGWRVVAPSMPMRIRASVAAGWTDVLPDSIRAALRSAADSARARRSAGV